MDDGGSGDAEVPALGLPQLSVVSALGRGGRGVVFLAVNRVSGERFALKTIPKASIRGERNKRVGFERRVLSCTRHPLLPRLRGVFESQDLVGYAIDYCPGRDLHTLRKKQIEQTFSNNIIRFYAAELVLALEYLHSSGVIYRDLKPENILIQENGHVMLVDFDLSTELSVQLEPETPPSSSAAAKSKSPPKKMKKQKKTRRWLGRFYKRWCNSGISPDGSEGRQRDGSDSAESGKAKSFVGTEEYVAPEIIIGGHSFEADWWSLGVVLYEMLYGTTPFKGSDRKETFYRILAKTPELVGEATPLRDLIGKLLEKDPRERIGAAEIKGHDFFSGLDWDLILKISRPPFIPPPPAATEDTEGIKGIDVESFVREVFGDNKVENDDDDKNKENKCAHDDVDEEKKKENTRKGAWVEELNYPLDSNSNNGHEFSIF